ncbi:hypothetical protein [Paraburkholderia sediminicola]|uniref:hypothetical protein n=1 Tax=Paraburkholderia sediminicola TaxID=458836 RepID=UPI0038BCD7C8
MMKRTDYEVDGVPLFPQFENLVIVVGRYEQILVRYLGQDKHNVYLMLLGSVNNDAIALNPGPDTMQYRLKKPVGEMRELVARELVSRVAERGIPAGMKEFSPDEAEENDLKCKRAVVEYITRVFGNAPFMDREVYSDAVRSASEKFGWCKKSVRKYYERHLFYGAHRFSLIDQNWDKGAPGVLRRGAKRDDGTLIESGRKTFAESIDPSSKLRRVLFSERMRARLTKFVECEAHAPGATLTDIIRRFLGSLRGHNVGPDGIKQSFPIDPSKLPSEANTLKIARPIFKREKARLALLRNSESGRGYSAQIARGDLNVVDIDGTTVDCFLRYGDSTISIHGVLKPTVLLAIDRSSRAILGWYVTYRAEDADSFLACLFSVCTDKEDELARWNVSHLNGMVYGCPSSIFVDRGSGISEKMQKAVVGRMRQRLLMAAPGEGKAKGDVEQLMNLFQTKIAKLSGVTHGEPVKGKGPEKDAARKRNRSKLRKAPETATLTLEEFMRALLTVISEYNLKADMRRLRNSIMLEQNVPPVPKHMYLFNLALRAGDAEWDMPEETIIRRLAKPFSNCEAPSGIVSFNKKQFTSNELEKRAIEYEAINNGRSMLIDGYELFTSKLHALWDDNGHFVELEATDLTLEKFGIAIPDIRDYIQMRDGGDWKEEVYKNREHATAEQAVKGGVSQTTQQRMEAVERLPRTVNNRTARKTADAHASAAHTRAVLASVQGTPKTVPAEQRTTELETAYLLNDAQEIDINF